MTTPIDLRSDTVTRPTEAMRAAMARAEVGDDVYGEDPTVRALEERVAGLLGHEDALFTPTGSMANVLAVGALVGPGQEVLCEARAHIVRAELGAHGAITGLTSRTWSHPDGQVDLDAISEMYAPDMGMYFVRTTAVSVENTHNFAGGAVLPLADLRALRAWADEVGVANASSKVLSSTPKPAKAAGEKIADEGEGGNKIAEYLVAQKLI